ncbi:MAG TPA: hypothetical protein VKX29_05515 [Brumimicrobium sp.]|nr:hypothetical protein [Brumimicrobium sp.]
MRLKQLTYNLILLGLTTLSFGCSKKDLPEVPYENSPIFNVVGTINTTPFEIHAGKNDAYMHTGLEDLNGVDQFTGKLSNGKTSIDIRLFNTNTDIPSLYGYFVEKESYTISPKYGTSTLLKISKEDFSNSEEIKNIVWTIDNEKQTSSSLFIFEPGKYNVCAELYFLNGESAQTCNTIIVGYRSNANYSLDWSINQNSGINAFIKAPNNTISKIKWFVNDVFQSDSSYFNSSNTPEKFKLRAEVHFQNGVISSRETFINTIMHGFSVQDFTIIGQKSSIIWDSSVAFTIEHEGQTYESINNFSYTSKFVIDKISEFKTEDSDAKVKLLKGTLNLPFLNLATEDVVEGSFEIEIGVGY